MSFVVIHGILDSARSPFGAYANILNETVKQKFQMSDLGSSMKEMESHSVMSDGAVSQSEQFGYADKQTIQGERLLAEGLKFRRDTQLPLLAFQYKQVKRRVELCERILNVIRNNYLEGCPDPDALYDYDLLLFIDTAIADDNNLAIASLGVKWESWIKKVQNLIRDINKPMLPLANRLGEHYELSDFPAISNRDSREAESSFRLGVSS